jgi:hypothetical protein
MKLLNWFFKSKPKQKPQDLSITEVLEAWLIIDNKFIKLSHPTMFMNSLKLNYYDSFIHLN